MKRLDLVLGVWCLAPVAAAQSANPYEAPTRQELKDSLRERSSR